MTFSHAPWLVLSILGLTAVWLCLVAFFFRYIRLRHPAEYLALGEPSFRQGSFRVIGYLFRRGHRALNDPTFSFLCDVMLVCFTAVMGLYVYAFAINGRASSVQSGP